MAISRVFLKTKLLIKRLRALNLFLKGNFKGLGYFHMCGFGIFLKSDLAALISVSERFYFNKKMGGNSRPGSSRVSMFIDDQEEAEIPIAEQQDSRMKHLAVKAEERNEPGVLEGIYTASLMYMKTRGNDSSGAQAE